MKTVEDLILEARRLGHVLTVEDGDRVRCRPRLRGEVRRLAVANREALARELREEEDGELLPAPGDVVLGDGSSTAEPAQPVPPAKAKPAEWMPPRYPPDMSYARDVVPNGRSQGSFDRGDAVDEGRWD
jgi:hypothetical protein